MEHTHKYPYPGTPFRVEVSNVKNDDGAWDSSKVSVYNGNILIGEYLRNYGLYGAMTFYPFKLGNEWYALYSAHYTTTRVMKLYDDKIEDWCGQNVDANGFCPVEIYVPRYRVVKGTFDHDGKPYDFNTYAVDCDYRTEDEFLRDMPEFDSEQHMDFGFMCGCIWGDDSSWKIRYIDLSKIPEKVLTVTEKFGYWEMPQQLSLKECIDMSNWEPDSQSLILTKAEYFNLSK